MKPKSIESDRPVLSTKQKRNHLSVKNYLKGDYLFLIVHACIVLLPFLWLLLTSFKTGTEIANNPFGFPDHLSFANYVEAWTSIAMPNLFKNSLFVCSVSVAGVVFAASLTSYVIARFSFSWNILIYNLFLLGMMIPLNAAIIPLFINLKNFGIIDTYWALILPYIAFYLPLSIFLITGYMKTIPIDLEESSIIDGCGEGKIFFYIILPLSKPVLATAAIIIFMFLWNEFLFALVFLSSKELHTVPLGIMSFKGQYSTNYAAQTAGMVIAIIPTIVIFMLLRERIMKGMTTGSIKG